MEGHLNLETRLIEFMNDRESLDRIKILSFIHHDIIPTGKRPEMEAVISKGLLVLDRMTMLDHIHGGIKGCIRCDEQENIGVIVQAFCKKTGYIDQRRPNSQPAARIGFHLQLPLLQTQ